MRLLAGLLMTPPIAIQSSPANAQGPQNTTTGRRAREIEAMVRAIFGGFSC